MKLLRRFRAYIRFKKNQRFLKKHKVDSWKLYRRQNDPDVIPYATVISQFYNGYKYIINFPHDRLPKDYIKFVDWIGATGAWCDKNCSGKYRFDIHRVTKQTGLLYNEYDDTMMWTEVEEYFMNDISGGDVVFVAFKEEKDLTWFKLRWL